MTFNTGVQDQGTPTGQPNQDAQNQDQGQSAGEGVDVGKFLELQKRDQNAQQHISNLEGENNGMRSDLEKLTAELETARNKLAAQDKIQDLLNGTQTSVPPTEESNQPPVEQPDFDKMVSDKLQQHFTEREQEANFNKAASALTNLFKDKTDDHVNRVAVENDMSLEDAMELSKTKPKLFENLFIKPFGGKVQSPTTSYTGQNASPAPTGQPQITQEYWKDMRTNPKTSAKFWSVPVQKQYHAWVHSNNK